MATAIILDKSNGSVKVDEKQRVVVINNKVSGTTKISEILPFRVRFTNIGIRSLTTSAPIGIAIIGLNNYIL